MREHELVAAFQRARASGLNHDSSLLRAIADVRSLYPGMRLSKTTVETALARWQPERSPLAALLGAEVERVDEFGVRRRVLVMRVGPRPSAPRQSGHTTLLFGTGGKLPR